MITLKKTIAKVQKIASDTEDMDAALHLLDLESQLNATLNAKDDEGWDYSSIIIGFLIGFAVAVLVFTTEEVHADEINVNLTSWHSDTSYNYNNENFGLGYTRDINHHWQAKVGFYENSYKKQSTYIMANLKHDMGNWQFGVQFGFVTGYDDIAASQEELEHRYDNAKTYRKRYKHEISKETKNLNKFQLMFLPTATWKATKNHSLTVGFMPAFNKDSFSFATAAYNYNFW